MKSAGKSWFASIHHTFAAAKNTYSGFSFSKKSLTLLLSVKSNSFEVLNIRFVYQSSCNFLTIADQTSHLCHAMYIFEFLFIFMLFNYNIFQYHHLLGHTLLIIQFS